MVLLTQKKKRTLIIKLAEEGLTTREIAKRARVSLGSISKILREYTGDMHSNKKPSLDSQAFQMFKEGKTPLDVSISLNLIFFFHFLLL
jgi:transposase